MDWDNFDRWIRNFCGIARSQVGRKTFGEVGYSAALKYSMASIDEHGYFYLYK
jgi:hypothetical protein